MNLIVTIDGKEIAIPPYEVYYVRSAIREYLAKRVEPKKSDAYGLKEDEVIYKIHNYEE